MKRLLLLASVALALSAQAKAPADAPKGTTGRCADGTYTQSAERSGACSGHEGIKEWYAKAPKHPKGSTGRCEDGSYTEAKDKQGACSSHGGVKEWYAN